MRVVIQRVIQASVEISGKIYSEINGGLLVLLGIEINDTDADVDWLAQKVANIRIFNDANQKMNLSLKETGGDILLVSQFTLHADTKKGNRPSFISAAKPEKAIPLYQNFITAMEKYHQKKIFTGEFGAMMKVSLVNDGPATIFIDSKERN